MVCLYKRLYSQHSFSSCQLNDVKLTKYAENRQNTYHSSCMVSIQVLQTQDEGCRCWPVGLLETSLLTCWGYGRLFLEEDLLALILLVVCATTLGTTPPLLILSLHVILLSPLVLQKQLTTLLLIQYMRSSALTFMLGILCVFLQTLSLM